MKGGAYLAHRRTRCHRRRRQNHTIAHPLALRRRRRNRQPHVARLIEKAGDNAKYVLVVEPARDGGKIVVARKGVGRYDIRTTGRAAHSGARHEEGRSAIREMCHQVERWKP